MRIFWFLQALLVLFHVTSPAFASAGEYGKNLNVVFVGDPQVDNESELDYARKSIYAELASRKDIDFAVILGDLVNDNTSLMQESRMILDSMPFPVYTVPGNHDFDVYEDKSRSRDLDTYTRYFGTPDTSFVAAKWRFILMNNVRIVDKRGYEGGFTEKQKKWLDSLVNVSGDCSGLILATHIPVSQSKGRDSLMNIFSNLSEWSFKGKKTSEKCRILLVSGHTHTVRRHNIDIENEETASGIEEIIAGATCGSWWRGIKDDNGIPYALQNCGAPRGYFVCKFRNKDYTLDYKAVNRDDVCSAWLSGDSSVVVNIFGGHEDGCVRISRRKNAATKMNAGNGTKTGGCTGKINLTAVRIEDIAPEVTKVIDWNNGLSREERRMRRDEIIPLRRLKSPHLWRAETDGILREGDRLEIFYEDRHMKFRRIVTLR